jgi:hypothetical protein
LSYASAEGVLDPMLFFVPITESVLDPAAFVRAALLSGRAKADGRATIRGRETLRILVGTQAGGRGELLARLFVNARTYRPVRITINADAHAFGRAPLPLMCTTPLLEYACLASPGPSHMWIYDFAEYRYLPGTAANRKLTNIRAMHPHAEIV